MEKQILPVAEYTGKVKIAGMEIPCAVLYPKSEEPIRVFWQREIVGLLTGHVKGDFKRYLKPSNLQPYLPNKYKNKPLSESTIQFKYRGRKAFGFEATDLIDICKMYIDAKQAGELLPSQLHLAKQAEIIVFSFAKTGIIAVIDEATGYQEIRDRLALNRILDKYITDELQKWAKKFPDKFYQEIFRLNSWEYNPRSVKRPSVIGRWTKDLIYRRFPKGVIENLEDNNPLTDKGYRKYKHHQFLTEDIGNPQLHEYISNLIFLMKASHNWSYFLRLFERVVGNQPELFEDSN